MARKLLCHRPMWKGLLALVAISLVFWLPLVARAEGESGSPPTVASAHSEPDERTPTTKTEWYGGTTLLIDGIGVLTAPVAVGVAVYAVGAPVVHITKGEYWRAGGSVALRIGLPLALALAFTPRPCDGEKEFCGEPSAIPQIFGAVLGGLMAITVDAAALAYRQVPVKPKPASAHTYAPSVAVTRDSATLALSGTF